MDHEQERQERQRQQRLDAWVDTLGITAEDIRGGSCVPAHFYTKTPDGRGTVRWEARPPEYKDTLVTIIDGVSFSAGKRLRLPA